MMVGRPNDFPFAMVPFRGYVNFREHVDFLTLYLDFLNVYPDPWGNGPKLTSIFFKRVGFHQEFYPSFLKMTSRT